MAIIFSLVAHAAINLTDSETNSSSDPGSAVGASASGANSSASSSASSTALGVFAESASSTQTKPATGNASLGVRYTLEGNSSGGAVPLAFNFSLTGSMQVKAGPKLPTAVGSAHHSFILTTLNQRAEGAVTMAVSPVTPPWVTVSGGLKARGAIRVKLKPKVKVKGVNIPLLPEDIAGLQDIPPLEVEFNDLNSALLAAAIAQAIKDERPPPTGHCARHEGESRF